MILDESPCAHLFKQQISHLIVNVIRRSSDESIEDLSKDIYIRIFSFCTHLTDVEFPRFDDASMWFPSLGLQHLPLTGCSSSTLMHLNISVRTFDDCLRLLDGRLTVLRTFILFIEYISTPRVPINYQVNNFVSLPQTVHIWI
jgi:hypothetical protein